MLNLCFTASYLLGFAGGILSIKWLARQKISNRPFFAATAAACFAMVCLVWTVSKPRTPFSDFLKAYYPAGRALTQTTGDIWQLFQGHHGFVNLPIVAWAFAPFGMMNETLAALVFTTIGVVLIGLAWWILFRIAKLDRTQAALLLFLFAANGPLWYSVKEGNTTHIVFMMIVASFMLLRTRYEGAAGFMLGIAAVLKPPLLIFGAFFALRGRWRALIGGAIAVTIAIGLSLAVFGRDLNVHWYRECIQAYVSKTLPAYNVQSPHAFLARLDRGDEDIRKWIPIELNNTSRLAAMAMVAALYGAVVLVSIRAGGLRNSNGLSTTQQDIEFLMVLTLALITSPLSWTYYYSWLLAPTAFFLAGSNGVFRGRVTRLAGWVAICLVSPPIVFLNFGSLREFYARVLVSHYLFAGLITMFLLLRAQWMTRSFDRRSSRDGESPVLAMKTD